MQAGRLDKRIKIKDHTESPDPTFGDVVDSPFTVGDFWADVRFLRGQELQAAQQLSGEVVAEFTVRWRDNYKDTMTIDYNDRTYEITSIDEETLRRKKGFILRATARQT